LVFVAGYFPPSNPLTVSAITRGRMIGYRVSARRRAAGFFTLNLLTIATTLLLIARNGADHFISGSGSTSTTAWVIGDNCLCGRLSI
jgi:hypothetical protein